MKINLKDDILYYNSKNRSLSYYITITNEEITLKSRNFPFGEYSFSYKPFIHFPFSYPEAIRVLIEQLKKLEKKSGRGGKKYENLYR
jgi:hypothetical protein